MKPGGVKVDPWAGEAFYKHIRSLWTRVQRRVCPRCGKEADFWAGRKVCIACRDNRIAFRHHHRREGKPKGKGG